MKPFFLAQRQFQYRRHRHRLETISNDRPKVSINKKFDQYNKLRQRSCEIKLQKRIEKVSYENQVLLNKLLQISSKKSPYFSKPNLGKFDTNNNSQSYLPTPFTKKQLFVINNLIRIKRQIDEQNQLLGSRLMQKKSQLREFNTDKSIQQYVRIKKTLARNKQAKLQPFDNINKSYQMWSSQSRHTMNNNNDNRTSIGNSHRGSVSTEDDGLRVKTQPTTKCLKELVII